MPSADHIAELILRHLRNELKAGEQLELDEWRAASVENEITFQKLNDPEQVRGRLQELYFYREEVWNKLLEKAPELREAQPERFRWLKTLSAVAAAAIIIWAGLSLLLHHASKKETRQESVLKSDLPAGTNKAKLTLSNGSKVFLNNGKMEPIASGPENNIEKADSNSLIYEKNLAGREKAELFNTLETPRGGQFQLTLPDGTRVWLNAASSIKYPTAFSGTERNVLVTGEAYFEVTRNEKMPFVVKVNDASVEVLGTHFNVMAYSDEPAATITLLEGKVKLARGTQTKIMMPGDQTVIKNGSVQVVHEVDLDNAIAWKNGRTLFKEADIQTIMRMISRWYDVDIEYKGIVPPRSITGGISRSANLSELLKVLELNKIHFTLIGKKITITP